MGRTYSLATLLWLTTFIAGWLGLLRVLPELAAVFAFISILAIARTSWAIRRCAQAQLPLWRIDQATLFLNSQTVVIACILAPLVCGYFTVSIALAISDFDDGPSGSVWFALSLIVAVATTFTTFAATVWWLVPTRATPAPSRRLALAAGLPVAFFAACSEMFYGELPLTSFLVNRHNGPPSLLPRLVAALIVVPALVNTFVWTVGRRQSGKPASVTEIAWTLFLGIASTIGTALAAATCAYITWIWFYWMSAHEQRRSPYILQAWCGLCELLAPAGALSVATMVTIYLLQSGFTAGLSRMALALDLDSRRQSNEG